MWGRLKLKIAFMTGSPSWSPDGERIAFMSDRMGTGKSVDIYVMDLDGGNLQNLTNSPHADVRHPAWLNSPFSVSPAGKKFTMWGNRLKQVTDNINYRLFLLCIGVAFENKRRVDPPVSTLQWQQIHHSTLDYISG